MTLDELKKLTAALDLSTYSLTLNSCTENNKKNAYDSNKTDTEYLCVFRNQYLQIIIHYHDFEYLQVQIVRTNDKYFSMADYYKQKRKTFDIRTTTHKTHNESQKEFVDRTLDFIVNKFFPDIKHILVDGAWEEITFDWQGYK